jgi:hypothetical protein
MSDSGYTLHKPYRPIGVKLFNALGGVVRRLNWEPEMRVERILHYAQKRTGLSDFGSDDFLEPMSILVDEYQHAANFHPFGHLCMRLSLQKHAENRLLIEASAKRHPDRLAQPLNRPLYVIGLPRTGTTLLYNLLAQDPNSRPLMIYEAMFPAPTEKEDRNNNPRPRQNRANFSAKALNRLAPNLKQVHEFAPDSAEECGWLMNNAFVSLMFLLDAPLPNYFDYYRNMPHERMLKVYEFYRKQLQLMQTADDRRHWILKSPVHQGTLLPLMEAVPQANVVQTHRDPKRVIASCCSLVCMVRGIFTDDQRLITTGDEFAGRMKYAIENAKTARETYGDRITDVLFDDLVKDPIATVRNIYDRFGYQYSPEMEAGMKRWLAENPQGKHGAHKYDLEQFGLNNAMIDEIFRDYWPPRRAA